MIFTHVMIKFLILYSLIFYNYGAMHFIQVLAKRFEGLKLVKKKKKKKSNWFVSASAH